jgi:hypothetical protein
MNRFYRITLEGYGGDSVYIKLTKEAYDYWYKIRKNSDEDLLLDYVLESEDIDSFDYIPLSADFLLEDEDADFRATWRESRAIITKQYGIDYRCTELSVSEVSSDAYNSREIIPILENVSLNDYSQDYPAMLAKQVLEETESHYMLQVYSSEKGKFFEGVVRTDDKFDPNKLTFLMREYFNGDYIIENIMYNSDMIDSQNQDIITKGVSASIWRSR